MTYLCNLYHNQNFCLKYHCYCVLAFNHQLVKVYLWWELAEVSFLSRQNMSQQIFVHNQTFVTTNICAWQKLSGQIFLVTNTWYLWRWEKSAWPYATHDLIERFVCVRCFGCGCDPWPYREVVCVRCFGCGCDPWPYTEVCLCEMLWLWMRPMTL